MCCTYAVCGQGCGVWHVYFVWHVYVMGLFMYVCRVEVFACVNVCVCCVWVDVLHMCAHVWYVCVWCVGELDDVYVLYVNMCDVYGVWEDFCTCVRYVCKTYAWHMYSVWVYV